MSAEAVTKPVHFIFAVGENGEFGYQGKMPWKMVKKEMRKFKKITITTKDSRKMNAVIMGKNTFWSITASKPQLEGRYNVILSTTLDKVTAPHIKTITNFRKEVAKLNNNPHIESIFVIGGASVFKEAMQVVPHHIERLYLTVFHSKFDADVFINMEEMLQFFPYVNKPNKLYHCDKTGLYYSMSVRTRLEMPPIIPPRHEEYQYLDLIQTVINTGEKRGDRTGVGTVASFGHKMVFSLRNGTLPLFTTKQTFFRGIAEELIWFISGSTNAKELSAKGIRIWDGNSSRAFLDSRGLHHLEESDIGAGYGYQWRHFGAKYVGMHADYTGQGFDQLTDCIHKIKTNPTDRRIIMSAWNPADLHLMALPPCHMFCQFFVNIEKQELSCQMYQRSADLGLGIPFNVASYSLLTHMVAHVCGLKAGDFIHIMGDTHVYLNHIEPLKEQLSRKPFPFPIISLDPNIANIDDFRYEHIKLHNYQSHPRISMEMAV